MEYIELTKGQRAIVDWTDVEWLSQWKWQCSGCGYATRSENFINKNNKRRAKAILMHQVIFLRHHLAFETIPSDVEIDHINQNRLDNRMSNLRIATPQQNSGNRPANKNNQSGYKGVHYYAKNNSWRAQIMDHGKKRHIGYYATPEEAALSYNAESRKVFGEFAYQNLVQGVTEFKRLDSSNNCNSFRGVSFHSKSGKWMVYALDEQGDRKHLGYYPTKDDAQNAQIAYLKNSLSFDGAAFNQAIKSSRGVSLNKNSGKWIAYVDKNGSRKHLGTFTTEGEALAIVAQAKAKFE